MILFLISLFLLISPTPAYADDFNMMGDGVNNYFFQTVTYSVNEYPESSNLHISYDLEDRFGEYTSSVLPTQTILSITQSANMRRSPGVYDRVEGPPGTKVDIIYYYYNDAGHTVPVSKIVIPFSRTNFVQGNICNVVEGNVGVMKLNMLFNNFHLVKESHLKEYPGLGNVEHAQTGSFIIDTLTISNPLEVVDISLQEQGETIRVSMIVQNKSKDLLNHINIRYGEYGTELNLPALSTSLVQFDIPFEGDLGYASIENNNRITECAVQGSYFYDWYNTESVSVFAFRDDGGWVNGAYVQPAYESFCITRVPYTMHFPLVYENSSDDGSIEDIDVNLDIEEVRGLEAFSDLVVLPKTGIK